MYYVYAIKSLIRKYIYVGITDNPERRLGEHNSGYSKTTRAYLPFKRILLEKCPDRKFARQREKYYKSGVGKEMLKKIE